MSGKKSVVRPWCIDCDRTLVEQDLFISDLYRLFIQRPWRLPEACSFLLQGRSHLKVWLASVFKIDPGELTFRSEIIHFIKKQRKKKIPVYLATGAASKHAQRVAKWVGLFDGVVASQPDLNVKGKVKAEILKKMFGFKGFNYLGDCASDLAVWDACHKALVFSTSTAFLKKVKKINSRAALFKKK